MTRQELLAILKQVAPALSTDSKGLTPVLAHLCFDGKYVFAYDNTVALRVPCEPGFQGALPGSLLLSMLNASSAEKMGLEPGETEVLLTLGRAKLKLPLLPTTEFLFDRPSCKGATKISMDDAVLAAFKLVSRVGAVKLEDEAKSGTTIKFSKRVLTLFRTDNVSIVRCQPVSATKLSGQAVIMPDRFLELMLAISPTELLMTESGDLVARAEGGLELYGRVMGEPNPEAFEQPFEPIADTATLDIPPTMARCLQRAVLISKLTTISYKSGRLGFYTQSALGELRDSIKADLGGDEFSFVTSAEAMLGFADIAKHIAFLKHCVLLDGDNWQVLISSREAE